MRPKLAIVAVTSVTILASCTQNDKESAKEQTGQATTKARHDLHELGTEAKQDAQRLRSELQKGMNGDVKPSAAEAERKLDHAGAVARREAENAGRTLDRAAVVARVKAKLASDVGLASVGRVQVEYRDGTAILKGRVMTADQRRLAEQAASQTEGVQHVQNELAVQP